MPFGGPAKYERLGRLVAETYEYRGDDGLTTGRGRTAITVYECGDCGSVVGENGRALHDSWHTLNGVGFG